MKKLISGWILVLLLPFVAAATDFSSTNFTVTNPIISAGSATSTSSNFGLGQSLSQTAIGKSTSESFQLWSGFQYYFTATKPTLTATAGSGQVALSWTAPTTYLGVAVGSYDLGTGTVSGSYTFQSVGNVTSYTKDGLTNGTTYYFVVRAKTSGGTVISISTEKSAAPAAASSGSAGSGGGGGGGYGTPAAGTASIIFKGLASPGATVFVLRDGAVAATTTADPAAAFQVTIGSLTTGIYSFSFYAEDTKGVKTPSHSFIQSVTSGVTTTVDNIFLGPTIGASHSIIKQGDTMNFFGYTAPASTVSVFVNSHQQYIEKVTAENSGAWFRAFNTAVLEIGGHTSKSQSAKANLLSPYSSTLEFHVGDKSVKASPSGESKRSDLNNDDRVNLTDFSILLYNWNKFGGKGDINNDGIVNLTDFSILLYDWTG
ncbi:MAG: fibronectin type III domain-containing protein [Candidatus Doudnabacteria bacterium]|nr:fibronectin type III domain-containing protein [Candidatus Doudnabacteria bacterium]